MSIPTCLAYNNERQPTQPSFQNRKMLPTATSSSHPLPPPHHQPPPTQQDEDSKTHRILHPLYPQVFDQTPNKSPNHLSALQLVRRHLPLALYGKITHCESIRLSIIPTSGWTSSSRRVERSSTTSLTSETCSRVHKEDCWMLRTRWGLAETSLGGLKNEGEHTFTVRAFPWRWRSYLSFLHNSTQDMYIFFAGAIFTFFCFYLIWRYLG